MCSQLASQFQLQLLLAWTQHWDQENTKVLVFDPILTPSEKGILKQLGLETSDENLEGFYEGSQEGLNVFYLPHCPKQLLNNILWQNWNNLDSIVVIGNSLSEIVSNTSAKNLNTIGFVREASELCKGE